MGLADSSSKAAMRWGEKPFREPSCFFSRAEKLIWGMSSSKSGEPSSGLGEDGGPYLGSISGCLSIVMGPLFGHLCLVSAGADRAAETAASRAAWEDGMRREGGLAK